MSCEYCTDPSGDVLLPIYGVGPHTCFYKIPGAVIGQSVPLPKSEWPSHYVEDPDYPGQGMWYCEHCREGLDADQSA